MRYRFTHLLSLLFLTVHLFGQNQRPIDQPYVRSIIHEGIKVTFSMTHIDPNKPAGLYEEGDDIRFRFVITDTLTNEPLSSAYPAAWMDPVPVGDKNANNCEKKIASFLTGSILNRPDLDLNAYYVIALNEDASITVVDPLFGYGSTQLLNLILLEAPGADWVINEDQSLIYVSMPEAKAVAVINAANWKVIKNIPLPGAPTKLELQADEQYLWTICNTPEGVLQGSGTAVIDCGEMALKEWLPAPGGRHDICLSDDNRFAYVCHDEAGGLSIYDVQNQSLIKEIPFGANATAMDYSPLSRSLCIIDRESGAIRLVDGESHELIRELSAKTGLNSIRFTPNGRLAFICNPEQDEVYILDAALNKIIQTGDMEEGPDRVYFSDELAYVRHRESGTILMIPLDEVGVEGKPVPIIDFPGGVNPPGKGASEYADGIVQAPGATAVLVANPLDQAIFYYKEGMAAPMGSFNNYSHIPKAVHVIDRSIEEVQAGVYETVAKIRTAGPNDIAFFMDVPRMIHCFRVMIHSDQDIRITEAIKKLGPLAVRYLVNSNNVSAQEPFHIKFQLDDIKTQSPMTGLKDVQVMTMTPSGTWHHRSMAKETDQAGIYQIDYKSLDKGIYYLYVSCPSKGLSLNNPQFLILRAL